MSENDRRKGIGGFLLSLAEQLGCQWKMDRLMLTVLLGKFAVVNRIITYVLFAS